MAGERWLEPNWQDSADAGHYLSLLLRGNQRRQFGLLEEPAHGQSGACVLKYKILLWGKAGVGKTSTVAKLCGLKVPPLHYETPGVRVTSTYWPAKLEKQGKVVFFRFEFWDVGDKACAKFDHMLPACKDKADAVMFLFSFTDRASFEDLPNQMSQLLPKDSNVLKLVVGTRFDLISRSDVTEAELRVFAQQFDIPVLRIRNVVTRPAATGGHAVDGRASLHEIAPLMNTVGEFLLERDQRMANPRSAATTSSLSLPLVNIATALPRAPHQQAPRIDRATPQPGKNPLPPSNTPTLGVSSNESHNPIGPGRRMPPTIRAPPAVAAEAGKVFQRSDYTPPLQRGADAAERTLKQKSLTEMHSHGQSSSAGHGAANIVQKQPRTLSLSDIPRSKPAGVKPSVSDFSLGSIASSTPSTPGSSGEYIGLLSEPSSRSNSMPRQVQRPAVSRPTTDV
eukprot:scpid59623/ scgid28176/ REM2- and Rab-like small GTPase 1